ncbi:MAG: DUF302 domain-containing protein [Richelia sp. RM2_1_2]|nr:DUF302 domain-containing protein [Richelia sp. SM2_1_7]NJM18597.1 DUF302 domain-containing protein [Richelia sp. SM1_7_0]NJN11017.1 DUF302 domain-containing protein [Richelia sp. RM1_1_1]NJO62588.1 DUF302 domain-containing protein [Richelia sp. RM2_1_2]
MKKVLLTIAALGLFVFPAYATQGIRENAKNEIARSKKDSIVGARRDGIVRVKSTYSVEETVQRFESMAKEQGLNIVAIVNHQAGAASVNQELRPTQVIIFGNPAAGTPLMQCNQTAGIDLPQKALVWEDEKGQVWLGYNSPKYLSIRHQLKGCADEALERIGNALEMLAQKATQ